MKQLENKDKHVTIASSKLKGSSNHATPKILGQVT